jgi:hypothetical protein
MLNLFPQTVPLCTGVTRRQALQVGALGLGGFTLPQLLRAEEAAGVRASKKAVIMIYMCGAPSHQDMYDLKMEAPAEIRGEFRPIATSVPGIEICEHLPRLAALMHELIPLRSVYGSPDGDHDSYICYTGHPKRNPPAGGWPSLGAVTTKLLGHKHRAVPPFVGLSPDTGHPPYGSPGLPGFLGISHAAFRPSGPSRQDMLLHGIDAQRLGDRRALLTAFDGFRRDVDASGMMDGMDSLTQQAFNILTSNALAEALDVSREPAETRARYGQGDSKNFGDGAPRNLEHFLIARRLVEAGCRVVTLNFGRWDFHSDNFNGLKQTHLPLFDQGLSALIEDLRTRGMLEDVSVVAWGEFGRTPRINADAGRDHWSQVGGGLLAGGGMRGGQVLGSTDRLGAEIASRPIHFAEVFATLYRNLGLNIHPVKLPDLSGRPQYVIDSQYQPLREVV